jgi:hypothetical protein
MQLQGELNRIHLYRDPKQVVMVKLGKILRKGQLQEIHRLNKNSEQSILLAEEQSNLIHQN